MQLKQFQYFVVSADMGSFKKAADALYTTQPHVSKIIKALEEELNLQLLNRENRGVSLTPEGKKVYEYACEILMSTEKIAGVTNIRQTKTLEVASVPSAKLATLFTRFYTMNIGQTESCIPTCLREKTAGVCRTYKNFSHAFCRSPKSIVRQKNS